jgi:DNA end-binding protein Ku
MARTSKRAASTRKPKPPHPKKLPFHAFWSGSLSFGLVNIPVLLFPANRHSGVRLRMISPEGSLLERRFYCPRDEKEVGSHEIVRGFELDDGSYITVEIDELEAAEPEKTREIDLREFVDLAELPPMLLERGYYLTPLKEATKAYRLLADVMERTRRVGVATFVLRDREYLVAIFARMGILCAETLRFADEIRDPQTIGLPEIKPAPAKRVAPFERSIDALFTRTLSRTELTDKTTEALRAIIEKKRKAGRDVIRSDDHAEAETAPIEDEGPVDLLTTIRQSLRQTATRASRSRRSAAPAANGSHRARNQKPSRAHKRKSS